MLLENLRERDHLEDLGVEKMIILKWIRTSFGSAWTGLIWLRIGTSGGAVVSSVMNLPFTCA
jgi:hypothetical protein